jgi:hypothetical protein
MVAYPINEKSFMLIYMRRRRGYHDEGGYMGRRGKEVCAWELSKESTL